MSQDRQSAALDYQSAQDAAMDRRVAAITRALKWVGWAFLLVSLLVLAMALTPVPPLAGFDEVVVLGLFIPFGVGALFLVRAARRRSCVSMVIGGIGFVLLALTVVTFFIYEMVELVGDLSPTLVEAVFVILICSAIFLPIAMGLMAIGWGLLRLAGAFQKVES